MTSSRSSIKPSCNCQRPCLCPVRFVQRIADPHAGRAPGAAPALLPAGYRKRAPAPLLSPRQFCGPDGLGWNRRLQLVHAGLTNAGGFPDRVAGYLGGKYGYDAAADAGTYAARVVELLGEFAAALRVRSATPARLTTWATR